MSVPLAKRRRLHSAASTLHKPFKSPLRSVTNATANDGANYSTSSKLRNETEQEVVTLLDGASDFAVSHATQLPYTHSKSSLGSWSVRLGVATQSPQVAVMPIFFRSTVAAHSRPLALTTVPGTETDSASTRKPPNIHISSDLAPMDKQALIRSNRALEAAIRSQREDLDTLRQATKLVSSRRDEELVELVSKWRRVSREAAEEVFATVRERVNRMGGVGAWRERETKKREWMREWDAKGAENDGAPDEDADDDEEDESCSEENGSEEYVAAASRMDEVDKARLKEMRREFRREQREQRETTQKGAPEDEELNPELETAPDPIPMSGQDDDAFTMSMMLKILNIDGDVIGYDKEEERWVI